MNKAEKIPKRVLGTILSSVSAGVVPRKGTPYIAIGRVDEIDALTADLNRVAEGEGVTRFIIGRYGSGKSFLIQLMRGYAMDHGFVTADCDLSPERRLYGHGGLATYRELIKNLSCVSSPDGGALSVIIGKWYSSVSKRVIESGISPDDTDFSQYVTKKIIEDSRSFQNSVGGFDFSIIVGEYCKAYSTGDEERMSSCMRWLRGEYSSRMEARRETGLTTVSVIDDSNWYDYVKLICELSKKVGFSGLCIFFDEGVNLYKIVNRVSRESNYEKILSMYNDTMQGKAPGMMLVFGGTPQFLEDTRRGLYSYEALRSRLADGRLSSEAPELIKKMMGPVIRLKRLSDSELLALIMRICSIHANYYNWEPRITDSEMEEFLKFQLSRAGAETMITPREIIRDFVELLNLLYQNPELSYSEIMKKSMEEKKAEDPVQRTFYEDEGPSGISEKGNGNSGEEGGKRKITLEDLDF